MAQLNLRKFDPNSMTNPVFKDYPRGWYFGELVRGRRHGQGMFFWPGGQVYMGGWVNDVRSGFGIFRDNSGGLQMGTFHKKFQTGWGVHFNGVAPTINFPLPDDEEFLEAFSEYKDDHKELIIGDYEFGNVFEGEFRGSVSGGYGTLYDRNYEFGYVSKWTVGPHNKDERLDGFGTRHEGLHPRFQDTDSDEIYTIHSVQGEWIDGDFVAGPATQTISYWLRGAAIQVIQTTGNMDHNEMFDGMVSVSLDGYTIYGGRAWADENADSDEQVFNILDEDDRDMIDNQRRNTTQDITEGEKDPEVYDSSFLLPGVADTSPAESWVMDLMVKQNETATEIKNKIADDQRRLNETGLEYTNRFFVTDYEDDPVCKSDGALVNSEGLHLYFDLTFEPTFTTRLDADEDGNPTTTVYILCGNNIVGDFTYRNDKVKIDTDEPTIETGLNYNDLGMIITLPMNMLEGDPIEYRVDVEQRWKTWNDEGMDVLTREETIPLEGSDDSDDEDEDDENNDPEGMDVERDEDGNITGMGFSMTGNNPDQESKNLQTLLNVFKNGGTFAPIDEIMEQVKKGK